MGPPDRISEEDLDSYSHTEEMPYLFKAAT